jgi:hypothetical protein
MQAMLFSVHAMYTGRKQQLAFGCETMRHDGVFYGDAQVRIYSGRHYIGRADWDRIKEAIAFNASHGT